MIELHALTEGPYQDILQAIMDIRGAHANIEVNGNDDLDIATTESQPPPTQLDIIHAVSTNWQLN